MKQENKENYKTLILIVIDERWPTNLSNLAIGHKTGHWYCYRVE